MNNVERRQRREALVGSLLPFYLWRFHSSGQEGEPEMLARNEAFAEADRVIADSDERERQGE
jgi:hypothetical protein